MKNRNSKLAAIFSLTLVLAAVSSHAADSDDGPWTTAGSVGTVESGPVRFFQGMANISTLMPEGTTVIRYNISATGAVIGDIRSNQALRLDAKIRVPGDHARVRAFVMESSLSNGSNSTLVAFDSHEAELRDDLLPHEYQVVMAPLAEGLQDLDFQNNVYYLEVWLTKDGAGLGPGFGGASLRIVNASKWSTQSP